MRIRTNAKVNLFLRVQGSRGDGFHEIETIFHSVSLADDLIFEPASPGELEVTMTLSGSAVGDIPPPQENLVYGAARRLMKEIEAPGGARITIHKHIPIAAGLGGGSANAAGAIVGLARLWELDLGRPVLDAIAAALGSDVPFCLSGGTALATGRGEILTQLPSGPEMWFVLGITHRPLHTSDVYDAFVGDDEETAKSAPMVLALGGGDVGEVARLVHNDLEAAAFSLMPDLEAKKSAMLAGGALNAAVCGSGPTIFGIAADEDAAAAVAGEVEGTFDRVELAASRSSCVEWVGVT